MWSYRKELHKLHAVALVQNPPCSLGMDVAFLIDYTGSMGPVIDTAKAAVSDIVTAIDNEVGSGNYRLGLVISDEYLKASTPTYNASAGYVSLPFEQKNVNTTGPTTNQYNTAMQLFTTNNEVDFTNKLNLLNTGPFPLGDGVNIAEPLDIALDLVINNDFLGSLRINIARYILIFTDAPPGGDDDIYNATDITEVGNLEADCIAKGIKVIVIGNGATYAVWQQLATNTGGTFNTSYDSEVIISQIIAGCQELIPPIANANVDQILTSPTTSTTLDGSGSTAEGTITDYLWEKVSGGTATITSPTSAITSVTGMADGEYVFKLTVTDNNGLQDTDFMGIDINIPPVAEAGPPETIVLPTDTVNLDGSGSTDSDGTVDVYAWSLQSGPGGSTITTPSSVTTSVTGLVEGVYTFLLTVTDNDGAQGTDTVVITVDPA